MNEYKQTKEYRTILKSQISNSLQDGQLDHILTFPAPLSVLVRGPNGLEVTALGFVQLYVALPVMEILFQIN